MIQGRENRLVYSRMIWLVILTIEICMDLSEGGTALEVADLTKWTLGLTYFTFLVGLFSPAQPPADQEDKRNNILQAWKWFTILFELSCVVTIMITIIFWTLMY